MNNDLAEGRFIASGRPVAITDIRAPIFAVGTTRDHVAPWRSTYKINLLTDTEVTYVLTTGGHNVGIVSEPGDSGRDFRVLTKARDAAYIPPETYLDRAPRKEGSWWPEWTAWLDRHSGIATTPPPMSSVAEDGESYGDAPGSYVLQN
jgi:polyhydroxyalkanoate synthase